MSSESLVGRISHLDLTAIVVDEAAEADISQDALWLRGGFPDSLTAPAVSAGVRRAVEALAPDYAFLAHPGAGQPPYSVDGLDVIGLPDLVARLRSLA